MTGNLLRMPPGMQPAAYGALYNHLKDESMPADWFHGGQEWAQRTAGLAGTAPMAAAPKPVLGKVPEGHVYIPNTGLQQMEGYTPPVEEEKQPKMAWDAREGAWREAPSTEHPTGRLLRPPGSEPRGDWQETVEVGPDGTMIFRRGYGDRTVKPSPSVKTQIQKDWLSASDSIIRLQDIGKSFDKELLEWGPRAGAWWTSIWTRAGFRPSGEDAKFLGKLTKFKSRGLRQINAYINEITGAVMNKDEVKRIRGSIPDPGEGIFNKQSAIEFISNYEDIMDEFLKVEARRAFLMTEGWTFDQIRKAGVENRLPTLDIEIMSEPMREYMQGWLSGMAKDGFMPSHGAPALEQPKGQGTR
jgi:hypothetical protein